jgi:hypothetical protein
MPHDPPIIFTFIPSTQSVSPAVQTFSPLLMQIFPPLFTLTPFYQTLPQPHTTTSTSFNVQYSLQLKNTAAVGTSELQIHKVISFIELRGDADKYLARPGIKPFTGTILGIYSTYPHKAQCTSWPVAVTLASH